MSEPNYQKLKLLILMEMLRRETDEDHPLRTSELCARLKAKSITCDRRTLGKDIALLNEQGFEVMSAHRGHEKAYYVEDRSFSVPELKILIDAVQAAGFITPGKTEELTAKIAALGGGHRAEIIEGNLVCFNTRKHSNEGIYYNVGFLEKAVRYRRKASFRYFDLDENGEKVYRKNGERYVVDPMALVYNEDNYYLMCYSAKYGEIANYRVDRMTGVEIEDDAVCEEAFMPDTDIARYTERVFKMYGGREEKVQLLFSRELIGVIHDKFGEDIKMVRIDEDTAIATVRVQISPTFWGWVFQFGGKMRIISPDPVIEGYKRHMLDTILL